MGDARATALSSLLGSFGGFDIGNLQNNGELLQQVALLQYLKGQNDPKTRPLEMVTSIRIGKDVWDRLSGRKQVDALREATIASICNYIKKNPRASKQETTDFVGQEIVKFANALKCL